MIFMKMTMTMFMISLSWEATRAPGGGWRWSRTGCASPSRRACRGPARWRTGRGGSWTWRWDTIRISNVNYQKGRWLSRQWEQMATWTGRRTWWRSWWVGSRWQPAKAPDYGGEGRRQWYCQYCTEFFFQIAIANDEMTWPWGNLDHHHQDHLNCHLALQVEFEKELVRIVFQKASK